MPLLDRTKIEEILNSIPGAADVFFVDLMERKEGGRRIIQLFVDTDPGITIAECAHVSREVGGQIDALGFVSEPYQLEVSSPGIDKPLTLLRQYGKNIGRRFNVRYWNGSEKRSFVGTLKGKEGDHLTFETDKKETLVLDFSKIIESIEELPW
jgi:ribosome maturation factor RimP